jgi:N-acetylgalactosamine-6-sulfatase
MLAIGLSTLVDVVFAAATKPNIIFLLADDWGWGDVGIHHTLLHNGLEKPETPRLDKLAKEGTVFTDFHTLGAECSPSRASFMTGRSPSDDEVRIHLVISSKHEQNQQKCLCADFLDTSVPTVTSVMKDAGYAVGHFGKVRRD